MRAALSRFADALQDADVGLFFYAGHGMQVRGQNYLVPIDATLAKETDLIFQAVDLDNVLKLLDDRPRTSLVFLDACRGQSLRPQSGTKHGPDALGGGGRRTRPGRRRHRHADRLRDRARRGCGRWRRRAQPVYRRAARQPRDPGLEVRQMLTRVRKTVIEQTSFLQVPWDSRRSPAISTSSRRDTSAAAEQGATSSVWKAIEDSTEPEDFSTFIAQYPDSALVPFARTRLAALARPARSRHRPTAPKARRRGAKARHRARRSAPAPIPTRPARDCSKIHGTRRRNSGRAIPEPEPPPAQTQPASSSEPPVKTAALTEAPHPESPSETPTAISAETVELALGWSAGRLARDPAGAQPPSAIPPDRRTVCLAGGDRRWRLAKLHRSRRRDRLISPAAQRTRLLKEAGPDLAALAATGPPPGTQVAGAEIIKGGRRSWPGTVKPLSRATPGGSPYLGVMYGYGRGVALDDAQAVAWYRKAAEQGWPKGRRARCQLLE